MLMEDTTISLAIRPERRATAACQVPKPRGTKTGERKVPMEPRMEEEASDTMPKAPPSKPKVWRNQSSTLMARIRVPAFTRKPFTFSHTWRAMFFRVGRR